MNDAEEFLEHYGVKGMKWGVRRKRRGSSSSSSDSHNSVKTLSDEELKRIIQRMELERKYSDLSDPKSKKGSKGKKVLDDVLTQSGKNVGTTLVTGAAGLALAAVLSKKLQPHHVEALTKVAVKGAQEAAKKAS